MGETSMGDRKRKERDGDDNGFAKGVCSDILDPISPCVLSNFDSFASKFNEAKPYKHGMINDLFVDGFLQRVLNEVKVNSTVKFKESDLFRVYQSIDLGNLDYDAPAAKIMPSLMKLKRALYSIEFRSFVEKINSLDPGTLTDQVDCAANCHTQGCHLLCHDDVIGNRKVSFIIYLTDPSREWNNQDGGRLELYDSVMETSQRNDDEGSANDSTSLAGSKTRKVPCAFPSKTILPRFNSMAYFAVTPGESFHSVQEVFCERPRLSIQGWYHTASAPVNMEDATLSRLKSNGRDEDTEGTFSQFDEISSCEKLPSTAKLDCEASSGVENGGAALSEADRRYLSCYVNEIYLQKSSIDEIRERFEEDSSVQLRHFLNEEWSSRITSAAMAKDESDAVGRGRPALKYDVGVSDEWKAVGPAHKQRFLQYEGPEASSAATATSKDGAGALLRHLERHLFGSPPCRRWLESLTSLDGPTGYRCRVRRFRPGLDYTVAHHGILTTKSVLDATLCFASGEGRQCLRDEATGDLIGSDEDALWESGDVGGFECYISAADDDDDETGEGAVGREADEVYDEEDDSELLSISASNNTLSLVYRDPGTMRFIKYVGSRAPSSRWDLSVVYKVPADSDDEEEGDNVK